MKPKFYSFVSSLLLFCFASNLALAAPKYIKTNFISGIYPDLALELHEKSFNLDLLKTDQIRARVKVNNLYISNSPLASFTIRVYEFVNGDRKFLSAQSLNIQRGAINNRVMSISAGSFDSSSKNLEFELLDTENNIVGLYQATIKATNLSAQPSADSALKLSDVNCPAGTFGDCQMAHFFENKVQFRVKRQKQASVTVSKNLNNVYTVTIPVPRKPFKYLRGNRLKGIRIRDDGNSSGSGAGTSDFGDTISASVFRAGPAATGTTDHGRITYDPDNNQLEIGFATTSSSLFNFGDSGRFGIGVDDPKAYLNISAGTATTPSILLEPGVLSTLPINGAIEFDGDNLYLTKNNTREILGATGPAGPQGQQGPAGPQGQQGPAGPLGPVAELDNGNQKLNLSGGAGTATLNLPNGGSNITLPVSGTLATQTGMTPFASANNPIDIDLTETIDVTGLNFVKITDSNPGTSNLLKYITGGVEGHKVTLVMLSDIRIDIITSHEVPYDNGILWGLNMQIDPKTTKATEVFEFVYVGSNWKLMSRYTL